MYVCACLEVCVCAWEGEGKSSRGGGDEGGCRSIGGGKEKLGMGYQGCKVVAVFFKWVMLAGAHQ